MRSRTEIIKGALPGGDGILACVNGRANVVAVSESHEIAQVPYLGQVTKIGTIIVWKAEDNEFNEACHTAGLEELNTIGCHFTWTNRRVRDPILSRLDRVLVSSYWFQSLAPTVATICPPSISDHSPVTLTVPFTKR